MKKAILFLAACAVYVTMSSEVPLGGQCGGEDYDGDTNCVWGYSCYEITPAYSECILSADDPSNPTKPTGHVAAFYTAHCSGTTTVKTVVYKNAKGDITGTVNYFGTGSITGSAGAGWVSSTTTTSVQNYDFMAQGNSCPAGNGSCSTVNPCP